MSDIGHLIKALLLAQPFHQPGIGVDTTGHAHAACRRQLPSYRSPGQFRTIVFPLPMSMPSHGATMPLPSARRESALRNGGASHTSKSRFATQPPWGSSTPADGR